MPRRFPLSARILLLFLLNLALLAGMFWVTFSAQFRTGSDWLLPSDASERIDGESEIILNALRDEPVDKWTATLQQCDSAYQNKVHFVVFDGQGSQTAGAAMELPAEIRQRLGGPPHHIRPERNPDPGPEGERPPHEGPRGMMRDPRPKAMSHTKDPSRYWVIVRAMLRIHESHPEPANLILVSETLGAGGLFFEVGPWIKVGLAAIGLSALLWLPMMRGINRSIAQLTAATRQIAEGRFETRVPETRRDELGDLGRSVNQMAARLDGLVTGQKRFLGDVAHELCSPLAKLRVSLGILEQRAGGEQKDYVARADEEAGHISSLVNELLSFSKASLTAPAANLQPVNVREAIEKAVRRESTGEVKIVVDASEDIVATADSDMLTRALSNLVRNAVRYAGAAGPITVAAQREHDKIAVTVSDCGPGVPQADLLRIFDPFYRTDASRDRETGGVGLGLAIVKKCIESCGGVVACRNLEPSGLEVAIRLTAQAA